jgi:hypothetical protein
MEGSGNGEIAVHTENKIEVPGAGRPLEPLEFDDQPTAKKAKVGLEEDNGDPVNNTQGESYPPGLNGGNGEYALFSISFSLVTSFISIVQ